MKKIKKIIVSVLCVVLCLSMCMNVSAASGISALNNGTLALNRVAFVNKDTISNVNSTMQGMCIDRKTNTVYTAKNSGDNNCMIIRTSLADKKPVIMKSSGNNTVNYLGHANDMTFVNVNGKKYIYVATMGSTYDIVKLEITGENTYKKVKTYNTGEAISGIAFVGRSGNILTFIVKKGATARIMKIEGNKIIELSKGSKLSKKGYEVYNKAQNIAYYNGNIYATYYMNDPKNETHTLTTKQVDKYNKRSNVLLTYDYATLKKKVETGAEVAIDSAEKFARNGDADFKLFEVEAVDVASNGKMYFALNVNTSKPDANGRTDKDRIVVKK